jgi:thymidylate synthase
MIKSIDEQYIALAKSIIENGEWKENRTGYRTLSQIGGYLKIDCSESFPLLTTKKVFWKAAFAEMLGFIRAYDNAEDFRKIGCNVWDKDANENQDWLNNPNRRGTDDLKYIYGVQWRYWSTAEIDQLQMVVDDLKEGIDTRREIVTAWNPQDMEHNLRGGKTKIPSQMALPPCHILMQWHLTKNKRALDLSVYQRSWDAFLGAPFNIAQYAFLLHLISGITNKKPNILHFHPGDVHIYEPHIPLIKNQIARVPKKDKIKIDIDFSEIKYLSDFDKISLNNIDDWVKIHNYNPHPAIKGVMYTTPNKKR